MKRRGYGDLRYSIRILSNGGGTYTVEVPKLPGCYSTGSSRKECIENIIEAIDLHLEGFGEGIRGGKLPPPEDEIPSIEVVRDPPSVEDYLVSLPEACRFLDVSDATLRRYIKSGKVPAYSFGKEYKFKLRELAAFVDACRVGRRKVAGGR